MHQQCTDYIEAAASRDVLRKMCSENMQQMYRRIPMPKCDFLKYSDYNRR